LVENANDAGLSEISKLGWLRKLQILPGDEIIDLAPLEKLGDLVYLDLFRTKAKTLAPIGKLVKLERLTLSYMSELRDPDLRALSPLARLRTMELRALSIEKLDGLEK